MSPFLQLLRLQLPDLLLLLLLQLLVQYTILLSKFEQVR